MKYVSLRLEDGSVEQAKLVNLFEIPELGKTFAIITKGEAAGENLEKIYISEVELDENGKYYTLGINSNEDWEMVKKAMKELLKKEAGDGA